MDIKLRARLSAYSRVSEVLSTSELEPIQYSEIDTLFEMEPSDKTISSNEFDSLFK